MDTMTTKATCDNLSKKVFLTLVDTVSGEYNLRTKESSDHVVDFYAKGVLVFKIIHEMHPHSNKSFIVLSFNIYTKHEESILWYVRVSKYLSLIKVAESFIETKEGTFYGEDAVTLKSYITEQEVISKWLGNEEEAKKFTKETFVMNNDKAFSTVEDALKVFNSDKSSDDVIN